MEFITPLILVLMVFSFIVWSFKKIEKIFFKQVKYSQSYLHNMFKQYDFVKTEKTKKVTQMSERLDKDSVNVIVLDNKAYWVVNNIFYNAEYIDGNINTETIEPINTDGLSRKDLDKMLLILDKLGDGNINDSGGTR